VYRRGLHPRATVSRLHAVGFRDSEQRRDLLADVHVDQQLHVLLPGARLHDAGDDRRQPV